MHVMCAICYTRFANVLCTHLQAANAGQRRRGYIHGYRLRVYSVGWETTKTKDDVWWGRRMRGYLAGLFTSIGGNAWHDRSSFAWMPLKASKMAAFLCGAVWSGKYIQLRLCLCSVLIYICIGIVNMQILCVCSLCSRCAWQLAQFVYGLTMNFVL